MDNNNNPPKINNLRLGVIAGNRLLPLLLIKSIKEKNKNSFIAAVAFRGETSVSISRYADKVYWVNPGRLGELTAAIKKDGILEWVMAGQVSPVRIFRKKLWDDDFRALAAGISDFRPHTIFTALIGYLQNQGVIFLDSTLYLKDQLAGEGVMDGLFLSVDLARDIDFGVAIAGRYVELDVGQTIAVKQGAVVSLESFEGTDRAIKRAYSLGGAGCVILKFCKRTQDLRFDVPVVGLSTLKLLKKIKAGALVLEKGKVIILEKERFLSLAKKFAIPVIGK
jgi:DUF1009 family protein